MLGNFPGAQLSESMAGEYIVKAATKGEILIPRTLHNGGDNPVLCLINLSRCVPRTT
jgi:hypothetical protein